MLGYGGTSKPVDAAEYSTKKLSTDLAALLDLLDIKRAVLIGHDWGAFIVGRFALWYPDRLLALVMMSVPYTPPSRRYVPIEEVARRAPSLGYQVYFASPRSSSEVLAHVKKFLPLIFRPLESHVDFTVPASLENILLKQPVQVQVPCILNNKELQYYYSEFRKGMHGPLNYYRTSKFRHDEELG
jgi:soluble epoxide hydrolase/lipid-phosphate phosphatase